MTPKSKLLTPEEEAHLALKKLALPRTARLLPWLLGALMFAAYGLTLNHWVSPDSILEVASLQGLSWLPRVSGPVTYLILQPFVVLPPEWIPLAVNLFTAGCAAVTLGLLARSVALLPHDLSYNGQPWWIVQPPRLMTSRCPWLPPLVAVLVCGFQLTFWQNAITATSQMINLLMFAFVILCLLEFNTSRRDVWLLRGAFVYGLGMSNDWAMAAFLAPLLVALIWVKRLFVFNEFFMTRLLLHPETLKLRLLWQIPACWVAGLSLFLLPPAIVFVFPSLNLSYWTALGYFASSYHASLTNFPREVLLISCLVSVMPFFLISTHFFQFLAGFNRINLYVAPTSEDTQLFYLTGNNRWPVFWGTLFFQLVYGFFLLVACWTMFDSPISPRRLNLGVACLPLYYLGALSIGYFFGHFLLTSEVKNLPEPEAPPPEDASPMAWRERRIRQASRWLKYLAVALLAALALGYPAALFWKNLPEITLKRADPCGDYIAQVERELPPDGAVIVGSDSFRLLYLQSALIRSGRQLGYMVLDTGAFNANAGYVNFVRQNYGGFGLTTMLPAELAQAPDPAVLPALIRQLAEHYAVYCLPPAPLLEPFTEFCYLQPHGLLYRLLRYAPHHPYADPPSPEIFSNNVVFWQTFDRRQLPDLLAKIIPPKPPRSRGIVKGFLNTLRFWPEADSDSITAGAYYASALNDWGVELQREGKVPEAGNFFAEALDLNPQNAAAQINARFNANYLAHRPPGWLRPEETALTLGVYRDWRHVVNDGLVDDPNFCYMLGSFLAQARLARPAIAQFKRAQELAPHQFDVYASLAEVFLASRDYKDLLTQADAMMALSPTNATGMLLKANAYMELKDYTNALPLLNQVLSLDASNCPALVNRAVAFRQAGDLAAARHDFTAVVQIKTNAFPAYLNLAEIADLETNRAAAITNYQLFLTYAPTNAPEAEQARRRLQTLTKGNGAGKT